MDRTRNARAVCSAPEASGGGILSLCTEPDVCGLLRWLVGPVGGLWPGESGGSHRGTRGCGSGSSVCAALRGANSAKDVRRFLQRVLQECSAMDSANTRLESVCDVM